jgi:hypothetical protein
MIKGACMPVTSIAYVPSAAMFTVFSWGVAEESFRLTVPDRGAPAAATPLTTWDETPPPPPPPPHPASDNERTERIIIANVPILLIRSRLIFPPFFVVKSRLCFPKSENCTPPMNEGVKYKKPGPRKCDISATWLFLLRPFRLSAPPSRMVEYYRSSLSIDNLEYIFYPIQATLSIIYFLIYIIIVK